ncbi:hypothetical protein ACFL6R_03575 [Gemmatimonadota bacterium]
MKRCNRRAFGLRLKGVDTSDSSARRPIEDQTRMFTRSARNLLRIVLPLIAAGLIAGCGLDLITKRDKDQPPGPVDVLFIGNSLTSRGGVLDYVEAMAIEADLDMTLGWGIKGHSIITHHLESIELMTLIASQEWDYVILQEGSFQVAFLDSIESVVPPYEALKEIILESSKKARIVLCMDWAWNPMPEGWPDFFEFSQILHDGALRLARRLGFMVAPIGWMWKRVVEERPGLELMWEDRWHPNLVGGYLMACVYFATIFQKSPVGNDYIGELDPEVAAYLQQTAADIVLKNRKKWRLPGS